MEEALSEILIPAISVLLSTLYIVDTYAQIKEKKLKGMTMFLAVIVIALASAVQWWAINALFPDGDLQCKSAFTLSSLVVLGTNAASYAFFILDLDTGKDAPGSENVNGQVQ